MPLATLPGVGNKSLPDQRTANPQPVRKIAAIPTGRTIRHNNESGSPMRVDRGVADVDLCSTTASARALFILIWLPRVWLHCAVVGHKRRVGVIFKVGRTVQDAGGATEGFNFFKVRLSEREIRVFHAVRRLAQDKREQPRVLIVIKSADELGGFHPVLHALVDPLSAFR